MLIDAIRVSLFNRIKYILLGPTLITFVTRPCPANKLSLADAPLSPILFKATASLTSNLLRSFLCKILNPLPKPLSANASDTFISPLCLSWGWRGAFGTPAGLPLLGAPSCGAAGAGWAAGWAAAGASGSIWGCLPNNLFTLLAGILALTNLPVSSDIFLLSIGFWVLTKYTVPLFSAGRYMFSSRKGKFGFVNINFLIC